MTTLHYPRIETETPGRARLTTIDIPQRPLVVEPGVPALLASDSLAVRSARFVDVPPHIHEMSTHPAGARQIAVVLAGVLEVVASDGQICRIEPGQLVFAEDVDGGHISRVVKHPARVLFIQLDDEEAEQA
jgi:hypothetical protein